jgi:acetyltransferase
MDQHYLTPLFSPRSVVVFAGPDGEPARQTRLARVLREALASAPGAPAGPPPRFIDLRLTGTLAELAAARADLAVIALPPEETAAALEVAGRTKCRSALILSPGTAAEPADSLRKIARREGVHLLGPNSLGFQRPHLNLNVSALGPLAAAGSLALVSQSASLTTAMLDWARANAVGFSAVVTLGPHPALDLAQVLDFLASDARTQSIVVYLEGIASARRFMSALRSAANAKPVVVLKAGRHEGGQGAAQTHSRAIVGSDDVFDAALRRAGAVRVKSFVEMFSAAKCLASRYRPVGRRLAVITNGGGPGVLAADWINEIDLELGRLGGEQQAALKALLPAQAQLGDLIDLSPEAEPPHYAAALEAAGRDRGIDGVLAIYSPPPGSTEAEADAVVRALGEARAASGKPLLACWMGDVRVNAARALLGTFAIPHFRTPEAAVGAFGNIASFYRRQQLLQQTPPPLSDGPEPDIEGARLVIESVLAERRSTLTEMESKTLLSAFHIPVTQTLLARSAHEAMMIATQLGFPVALKIDSPDVTHKSDVGGVVLGVKTAAAARDGYAEMVQRVAAAQPGARINGVTVQKMAASSARGSEVHVGLVTDDPFGPVIVFGAGGTNIELIADRAMELPPLNQYLARRLIDRARVARTLGEWHGAPAVDVAAIERILLRVSDLVCQFPQLREMDINPLIVDEGGAVAVDARIVVQPHPQASSTRVHEHPHLAILPYPARWEAVWPLAGGGEVQVRPIRPDDAQMLQALVQGVSAESRYMRFVSALTELPAPMLARLTLIDYDREMALVALQEDRIVGVSRIVTNPDQASCEFSLLVADEMAGKGLGSRLMEGIMAVARDKGLSEIDGLVLSGNGKMLALMKRLGFAVKAFPEDPDFRLVSHTL